MGYPKTIPVAASPAARTNAVALGETGPPATPRHGWSDYARRHLPLLVTLWLLGILTLLLRLLGQLAYVQRLKSYGTGKFPEEWRETARRLERRLGVKKTVRYLGSRRIDTPLTMGWLRPVVLFPVELLSGLDAVEIRTILAHELAHVRRNDYLVNVLQSLLTVVFFYHPGAWWLSARLSEEREHCCDDLVLSLDENPRAYARTLIHLQENRMKTYSLPLAASGPRAGRGLTHRIQRLLQTAPRPTTYREGFTSALVIVFGLLTILTLAARPLPPAPEIAAAPIVLNKRQASDLESLIEAIWEGDLLRVRQFLASDLPLNAENGDGWTPLMAAAAEGRVDMMKDILERGADLDHVNKFGWTALIEAADDNSVEALDYLLKRGARVNLRGDADVISAAGRAAMRGNLPGLKLLIAAGAKLNDEPQGQTLLHRATEECQLAIMLFLVERGLDVNQPDERGVTPLLLAVNKNTNISREVVRYLLEQGADPTIADADGRTPLHRLAWDSGNFIVRFLREEAATAQVSEETITKVQDAFFLRQSGGAMMDLLLQSGADINRTDKDGNTPLMLAAQNDQPNMVAHLLQNQADKTLKRADGKTALELARAARNERIVALLE